MVETPASPPAGDRPWVWTDDREAAYEATRHLLSLGHETVHYVAIPSSTRRTSAAHRGWRAGAARGRAPRNPARCRAVGDRPAATRRAASWPADPSVTAILCGNDDLALGVLRALHEAGRVGPGRGQRGRFRRRPALRLSHARP